MQLFQETVLNVRGEPIEGSAVSIFVNGSNTLAAIFDENGDQVTNPLTADPQGLVICYLPNGKYDYQIIRAGVSVRLNGYAAFDPDDAGGLALPIADDQAIFANAADLTKLLGLNLSALSTSTTLSWAVQNKSGTVALLDDVAAVPPGFRNRQAFTSNGTFTPAAGVTRVYVREWAGGGGGGGVSNVSGACGSGGGAGAKWEGFVDVTPGVGCAVTVGTGGTAGANTGGNGGNGGNSSFAGASATPTAGGGTGGLGGTSQANRAGGAGGTSTGGIPGGPGGDEFGRSGIPSQAGKGGDAPGGGTGGQAPAANYQSAGFAGNFPGGGGSGASSINAGAAAGGAGAPGLVEVFYP